MNDNFYKKLMEESALGYAYYKIICDKRVRPSDYEFVGLNKNYEEIKDKKCYELIGLNQECEECGTRISLKTKKPAFIEKYILKIGIYLDCRSTPILD